MTAPVRTPAHLMTVRDVSEALGLPMRTAEAICRVIAREDGLVRLPGFRRVYVRRADFERRLEEAGAMVWTESEES